MTFRILAGQSVYDCMMSITKSRTSDGESLPRVQESIHGQFTGAEIVKSLYGYSLRYDSGLNDFGLIASARTGQVDGTLEDAERYARNWQALDPNRRYVSTRDS